MEHIVNAVSAIVLGVGALALYFYGVNWLLDWLLPHEKVEEGEAPANQGLWQGLSWPDLVVLVVGLIMLVSFSAFSWFNIDTDQGTISARGNQLSSIDGEKLEDMPPEVATWTLSDTLDLDEETLAAISSEVNDLTNLSGRVGLINRLYTVMWLSAVVLGLWGLSDSFRRRVAALATAHLSIFGLLYFIFLNFHISEVGYSFFDVAGTGIWIALVATIVLFAQVLFPRTPIEDYNAIIKLRERTRPWLFVGPALVILALYLVYPAVQTTLLSFQNADGDEFVGLRNYEWAVNDAEFRQSVGNNLLWLLIVPFSSTALGLLIAVLADRVRWGTIAKSFIFMPMAISFVGASVIWKFVYDFRGEGIEQIGILNAIVVFFGGDPQAWITIDFWNNIFLMIILIWIQTGFAMVLMSAALRGVPEETLEAARIDGANEVQIFFRIMIPQIMTTIAVVMTTITIVVLKIFDIVLAMTNGQWDTEVLANMMFDWMFRGGGDFGRGSMLAVVIMFAVIPIMFWNIRRFQAEEAMR